MDLTLHPLWEQFPIHMMKMVHTVSTVALILPQLSVQSHKMNRPAVVTVQTMPDHHRMPNINKAIQIHRATKHHHSLMALPHNPTVHHPSRTALRHNRTAHQAIPITVKHHKVVEAVSFPAIHLVADHHMDRRMHQIIVITLA